MGAINCHDSGRCNCFCYELLSDCLHNVIHCYDHDNGCHMNCVLPMRPVQ